MAERMLLAPARGAAAVATVALAACGGSQATGTAPAAGEASPARASGAAAPCPVTRPGGTVPAAEGFDYGNRFLAVALWPRGTLVAGPLPDGGSYAKIGPDGSIAAKLGWWRAGEGSLTIEGERLDAQAPPLRADVPAGYGPTGFQPTRLTFPTQGCWKLAGSVGRARLTFVVLVRTR
jgi:hypothetical protein